MHIEEIAAWTIGLELDIALGDEQLLNGLSLCVIKARDPRAKRNQNGYITPPILETQKRRGII